MSDRSPTRSVLLLEPDPGSRAPAEKAFAEARIEVTVAADDDQAVAELGRRQFDALLVALERIAPRPSKSIRRFKDASKGSPLLVVCPPDRVREVSALFRSGVDDYLLRPLDPRELEARLVRIIDRSELDSRVHFLQDQISKKTGIDEMEAQSPSMQSLTERIRRVSPMRSTVLIFGESGVGKELVARAIHFGSPRADQAFVALNCAAIPAGLIETELFGHEKGSFTGAHARMRGKFEIAHRGSLFLDEIAEMTPATQAKLLRLLEQREFMRVGGDRAIKVDVRVIAATNADLEAMVAGGGFRRDLYYRLKVVTMAVPPLRERREDIPTLTRLFLAQLARINAVGPKMLDPAALGALIDYSWPGNVRELKNLLESLLVSVRGDVMRLADLPPYVRGGTGAGQQFRPVPTGTLAQLERETIRRTLEQTGGNRTHSAEILGIGVRTLQRKIQAYGLTIPPRRRRPRRDDRGASS